MEDASRIDKTKIEKITDRGPRKVRLSPITDKWITFGDENDENRSIFGPAERRRPIRLRGQKNKSQKMATK